MFKIPAILFLLLGSSLSAPADEPIRIDLPVYDLPQAGSNVDVARPYETENFPGGEPVDGGRGNFISNKFNVASNLIDSTLNAKSSFGGPFSAPVTTLESAVQESEGYGSKVLSIKEHIQQGAAGIFQPKPIVDTISEEEKYGNTGDKFYNAGRALVGGAEGFSNFVNAALQIPGTIFSKITRAATEKLNNLGGRLIGLA